MSKKLEVSLRDHRSEIWAFKEGATLANVYVFTFLLNCNSTTFLNVYNSSKSKGHSSVGSEKRAHSRHLGLLVRHLICSFA